MGETAAGLDLDLHERVAILKPWGVLDVNGSAAIRPLMDDAAKSTAEHFLFDLGDVSFLDGSGLKEIVRFGEAISSRGGRISLINGRPQVQRLLSVTGSARFLNVLM